MASKTSKLQDITNSLDQGGTFLQIHVTRELQNHNWPGSIIEYPTRASPFVNHPNSNPIVKPRLDASKKVHPKTYSTAILESQNQFEVLESSVDVLVARKIPKKVAQTLCIEVKKLDPKFIDWIFFRIKSHIPGMQVFSRNTSHSGLVDLFTIPPMFGHFETENYTMVKKFDRWIPLQHEISDFAVATNSNKLPQEYFRSDKSKIDESSRQILQNTYAVMVEKILHEINQTQPVVSEVKDDIFIPIIVTNATLWFCDINPKDIDPQTGHTTKQPKYSKLDSIIYELPNPKSVQFPDPLSTNLTARQNLYVRKSHVLILSSKGLKTFLDNLDKEKIPP